MKRISKLLLLAFVFSILTTSAAFSTEEGLGFTGRRAWPFIRRGRSNAESRLPITEYSPIFAFGTSDFRTAVSSDELKSSDELQSMLAELRDEAETPPNFDPLGIAPPAVIVHRELKLLSLGEGLGDPLVQKREPLRLELLTPENVDVRNGLLDIKGE